METTSTSAFARLLATENIRVRHLAEAETASFDVVDRVLTLPKWRGMSEELYDMKKDPKQFNNLARNPAFKKRLETQRKLFSAREK